MLSGKNIEPILNLTSYLEMWILPLTHALFIETHQPQIYQYNKLNVNRCFWTTHNTFFLYVLISFYILFIFFSGDKDTFWSQEGPQIYYVGGNIQQTDKPLPQIPKFWDHRYTPLSLPNFHLSLFFLMLFYLCFWGPRDWVDL